MAKGPNKDESCIYGDKSWKKVHFVFILDTYLTVLDNPDLRRIVSKFRLSDHKLEIEIGRYNNIPADRRLCKLCKSAQVEDEKHFLLQCPIYKIQRQKLFDMSEKYINNFKNIADEQKFKEIITNKNLIIILASYIKLSMLKRDQIHNDKNHKT